MSEYLNVLIYFAYSHVLLFQLVIFIFILTTVSKRRSHVNKDLFENDKSIVRKFF